MRPLARRYFALATLLSLVAAALVVIHAGRGAFWSSWLIATFGAADATAIFLWTVLGAGLFIVGVWSWFAARRFRALRMPRWPALLPVVFWALACAAFLVAFERSDPIPGAPDNQPIVLDRGGLPTDPGGADIDRVMRDRAIVRNLTVASLGLAALALVAAAWCTLRGFRPNPTPIEDHFA